ncbi:MAG: L-glutamate gamma-semialdehyde dehydrogenase [Candidatus Marinimicrobia bacterium]|nr:L-glutamate gamma-semialdehyde dehydrogenase [Candidatus Neomarinimicrobiota bacterium]MCF7827334.1 L-glutamate gamma-semialdehyde dehydrogenase [Candidatus Neomarinimicrobiota bacterium]MCF7881433.1 L-glutamate gamma-semialdehyde dehydrogenase [Candidatus Neomarinimicrobiota bacterium]
MYQPYEQAGYIDFSKPENQRKMQDALEKVKSQLGQTHDLIIGGERVQSSETFDSINPAKKDQVIGTFQQAEPKHVDQAMDAALEAWEEWKHYSPEARAAIFARAGHLMQDRRFELIAWQILEQGKSWPETDAEVSEAIDFQNYYAREALRYGNQSDVDKWRPRENNEYFYIPLGVGAIIPPWNFPLAIMSGMSSAAMVTGNCIILKPSSDAPAQAYQYVKILEEVGLPKGVVNLVTGGGGRIGDKLVGHPKTRFIAFTGSKKVGLHINELAAKLQPGQKWIKRVSAEMGGKDAMVVLEDAPDMAAAADAAVQSAFGYSGQKCSACSRLILEESIHDEFVEKVIERAKKLTVGPPDKQENWMGPVINEDAESKILEYIKIGKEEGKLVLGGKKISEDGYYIEPTIFTEIDPGDRMEQEEIFGPVLSIIKARDYDHALEIANDTDYGLTGGVWTKDQAKIERAKREFHVGNLYFNRGITGSIVGSQPFGGFNLSGTDNKAGGKDYLLFFQQAKTVTQRL